MPYGMVVRGAMVNQNRVADGGDPQAAILNGVGIAGSDDGGASLSDGKVATDGHGLVGIDVRDTDVDGMTDTNEVGAVGRYGDGAGLAFADFMSDGNAVKAGVANAEVAADRIVDDAPEPVGLPTRTSWPAAMASIQPLPMMALSPRQMP